MTRRTAAAAVTLAGLLALSACGGGGNEEPAEADQEAAAESAQACEEVPQGVLDNIAGGAKEGTGLAPVSGAAYRSPDFEKVYLVAMEFSAEGVENQVGVWATNSLDPAEPGMILAVDGFAKEFTTWVDAETTDAAIGPADPSADAAEACLA